MTYDQLVAHLAGAHATRVPPRWAGAASTDWWEHDRQHAVAAWSHAHRPGRPGTYAHSGRVVAG